MRKFAEIVYFLSLRFIYFTYTESVIICDCNLPAAV